MSELHEVQEAEVAFAAFDAADVVTVEGGTFGQLLLRQALRQPQLTDMLAEQHSRV